MSSSLSVQKAALYCSLALIVPWSSFGENNYATNGGEFPITGTLPGDQFHPRMALTTGGGYLVWDDNVTDGFGLGISALRLDSSFASPFAPFRVNTTAEGDQEHPQVSLLNGGGAAFAWQGGPLGFQHIYARFLSSSNTWLNASDIQVNAFTNKYQVDPAIATLANGNVIIVYGSWNQQADTYQDVYGQMLSPTGEKIGSELLVNQFTAYNQRVPSVAALPGGGFVIVWCSELQRSGIVDSSNPNNLYQNTTLPSVDVFARFFATDGTPSGNEFMVNTGTNICANPRVAVNSNGSFMVTWGEKDTLVQPFSWDIFARPFSSSGVGGLVQLVNDYQFGDQYGPQISSLGTDYLVAWTSLGQDGSREGVFGQFLNANGSHLGVEFRANTTTISRQIHPAVASDGTGRFLVSWASYAGGVGSFDLYAQQYVNVAQPLTAMSAPFVWAPFSMNNGVYHPQLQVSWTVPAGLPVDHYEIYLDGSPTPAATTTTNIWFLSGVAQSSTHSFRVSYVTADGRIAPLSASANGTTWSGYSWGNIPFEWMAQYYGGPANMFNWPAPNGPVGPNGPSLLQVFLSGGNPLNSSSWLRTWLVTLPEGRFLNWNPQPGLVYQVQTSGDLVSWSDFGPHRFASGNTDSVYVGGHNVAYYRVLLLR